ncbi:hypothetical protein AKJ50_01105 [candidate division MSBL1 archaeon SCGC-AAA382A13]|uniref:FAD/NAD(P)-binding domain-containing protein n=1 Tax=candidate division MSBL1 archaeon SCGC-AAA382A13 TaxID=1698279 RepID=A0A133VG04_9EURY|nr:hypothetical protein AKJ50_01105 [candidate division MSBL1 archaeon SCGC-AAA382A13]
MNNRIWNHPVLDFERGEKKEFYYNGQKLTGYENETIAAALFASGVKVFRKGPRLGLPRGWFCGIGKCSSCLMKVNDTPNVRTCTTMVEEGMRVEAQEGKGKPPHHIEEKTRSEFEELNTQLLIIGAGPAGLEAGITAEKLGMNTLIIDENPKTGGQLVKQTHKFFGENSREAGTRGTTIAQDLQKKYNGTVLPNMTVIGYEKNQKHTTYAQQKTKNGEKLLRIQADQIIVTTGARENYLSFQNNYLPGVYAAGGVQTLMNTYGIKPGNKALIVGSGNVGLILAYQLLQAGVKVKAVAEALPEIGGYLVHSAKIGRQGVPILTNHTIKKAKGENHVTGAVITELNEDFESIPGSEKELDVDLICIAVGLTPSAELLFQAGCEKTYQKSLGGWIPIHNKNMETTLNGVYLAGDVSGIEEATAAISEGRIAAASIGEKCDQKSKKARKIKRKEFKHLEKLRDSSFLKPVKKAKKEVWKEWENKN